MYFGCHNHTEYSNITTGLDSINKLEDLVNKAKEFGMRRRIILQTIKLYFSSYVNI